MKSEAIAAVFFCAIEREVGLDDHGVGPWDVRRITRNPDAGRDMHVVALDEIGLGKNLSDLGSERASRGKIVDIALQDREFIAAETRH